ncbi:MAG: methionyl-tRNA formyltransferase [Rhizobiales bacterium]|nr:methionyl-tRNA formyltransferase [Hyphomicrobiales bacterium]
MRVAFMGSPAFAVPSLAAILQAGHEIVAVYSQPPRPAGRRGLERLATAVHVHAESHALAVRTPASLRSVEESEAFAALDLDVAVVVAYGLILPPAILAAPRHGCLNLHPSALPRWRGAAPIQRTVMAGDAETAVAVMRMNAGLDTGPVCLTETLPVPPDATAGEMHDVLAAHGARLMVAALEALADGRLECTPQPDAGVTYAEKISKAEARIDWTRSNRQLHDQVRGLSPSPGAWCEIGLGAEQLRLKVLRSELVAASGASAPPGTLLDDDFTIACGQGALRLVLVQREGRKAAPGAEVLRGLALTRGDRLP